MSGKIAVNKFLKIIAFIIIFGGIAAGVVLVSNKTNFLQKAEASTSLYFKPSSVKTSPGSLFTLKVYMNTGTNLVTAADYRLSYDTNTFEVLSVTQGNGISTLNNVIKNSIDSVTGTINLAVFTLDPASFVHGSRLQAFTINARVKETAAKGVYYVNFLPASAISAQNEETNVLMGYTSAKITVSPPRGKRK